MKIKESSGKGQGRVREGSGKVREGQGRVRENRGKSTNFVKNGVPSHEMRRKSYEDEAPDKIYNLRPVKHTENVKIHENIVNY